MAACNENEKKAFAQTLKLALATSIIRSKPEHLTAQEYARQLAAKLRESESSWKSKYDNMRKNLDNANQEIVLLKLQSKQPLEETENGDQQMSEVLRDLESKCANDNFLSIVNFKGWCNKLHEDDESLKMIKKRMMDAMRDMESSFKSLRLDEHNVKYVETNLLFLRDMLKTENFSSDTNIINSSSGIIRTAMTLLMNSQAQYTTKERMSACLNKLSRSSAVVRDIVMETLVLVVSGYTALLKDLPSFTCLNVDKYDNIGYVCKLLNNVISTCSVWPTEKLYVYSQSLDEGLMEINSTFLLYAQTVWTISSLMMEVNFQKDAASSDISLLD